MPTPTESQQVAVLVLAAHYFDSVWNEVVGQEAWDWAFAEGHVAQVNDQTGEAVPFLTDKGQSRLRGLLGT